jgi:hypothetical protein
LQRCLLGPIDLSLLSGDLAIDSSVLSSLPVPQRLDHVLALPADISAEFTRLTMIGGGRIAGKLHATDSLFDGALLCTAEATFTDSYVTDLLYPGGGDDQPAAEPTDAPPAAVTRCSVCGRPRSVRLRSCLLRYLRLAPDEGFCTCETPSDGATRDCLACDDPLCAETCPLRAADQSWEVVQAPPRFMEPNVYPAPDFARLSEDNPSAILAGASNRDVLGSYNLAVPTARRNAFDAALKSGLLLGTRLGERFES